LGNSNSDNRGTQGMHNSHLSLRRKILIIDRSPGDTRRPRNK
jgi:hypothetical protein